MFTIISCNELFLLISLYIVTGFLLLIFLCSRQEFYLELINLMWIVLSSSNTTHYFLIFPIQWSIFQFLYKRNRFLCFHFIVKKIKCNFVVLKINKIFFLAGKIDTLLLPLLLTNSSCNILRERNVLGTLKRKLCYKQNLK